MARDAEALKIRPWGSAANRQTPEAAGVSRATGFDFGFSLVGGTLEKRKIWNQLLGEITRMLHEINQKGMPLEWDSGIAYEHPAFVRVGALMYASVRSSTNKPPASSADDWRAF